MSSCTWAVAKGYVQLDGTCLGGSSSLQKFLPASIPVRASRSSAFQHPLRFSVCRAIADDGVAAVVDTVPTPLTPVLEPEAPAASAGNFLSGVVDSSKQLLSDAVEAIGDAVEDAVDAVSDIADSAQDAASSLAVSATSAVETAASKAQSLVREPLAAAPEAAVQPAAETAPQMSLPEENVFDVEGITGLDGAVLVEPPVSASPPEILDAPLPDLQTPSPSSVQVPQFEAPNLNLPEFERPELPVFKAPSLPEFKAPTLPEFKAPALPDFKTLELPEFKLPELSLPQLSLPNLRRPELPEFKLPSLSELPLPKIKLPTPSLPPLEQVPLPKLSIPPQISQPISAALDNATSAVQQSASEASAVALGQLVLLYSALREQVPDEYQPLLLRVESNAASFWEASSAFAQDASAQLAAGSAALLRLAFSAAGYDVDDSVVSATVILLGALALVVVYWRSVYGGYSGNLSPEEALQLLRTSRAVLVDLRPEEVRSAEGIPDLRRAARFKAANVEFEKFVGRVRSEVRNADAVDLQLMAAKINGLRGVSRGTQVVVMDESGSSLAKEIARGLARYGFERSYLLDGGFRAWAESGMRVKPNEVEPPVEILQKEFEAFVEEVKPTPEGIITAALVTGVGIYSLIEWQKAIKFVALLLVAQLIYNRAKTYETQDDLQRDLRALSGPFVVIATALGWVASAVAGPTESPQQQLATAPESPQSADAADGPDADTASAPSATSAPAALGDSPVAVPTPAAATQVEAAPSDAA